MAKKEKTLVEKFAENLRAERARRKMSQGDLAAAVGISTSYVSFLERGLRSPPLETVDKIATALKMKPVDLFQ
jgi:transcriptional regulator with XRE-family HTH domain